MDEAVNKQRGRLQGLAQIVNGSGKETHSLSRMF
jgi:hypothetical protein